MDKEMIKSDNAPKKKKPNGCLVIVGVLVLLGLIGSIAGGGDKKNEAQSPITQTATEQPAATTPKTPKVEVNTAEKTTLGTGEFEVGKDIKAGRYICTSKSSGNFVILDGEMPVINEILSSGGPLGVKSVTMDIADGQIVKISGMPKVHFDPASRSLKTQLTTGKWVVGKDIEPGRYICEPIKGSGNFVVYDGDIPAVNEILSSAKGDNAMGVPSVTVGLKDGQVIQISGIDSVKFTSK